ncbi:MAG: hypothetical protein GQ474_07970 [Sulfurimonas sp.]|nr:hypothetical protein [Sulfurimonas sp.]
MSIASFDLESNGLLYEADRIHCLCIVDSEGGEYSYTGANIKKGLKKLWGYDTVVAHNGLTFDFPLITKLYGGEFKNPKDTMIWSRMLEPDRLGGHSIEQYAKEYGMQKVGKDITDWSVLTDEMLDRCMNDARVGMKIYQALENRITSEWTEAVELEEDIAKIHAQQVLNGVGFDLEAANRLSEELEGVIAALEEKIYADIPLRAEKLLTTITAPFKRDGTYQKKVADWYGEDCDYVWGSFNRFEFSQLNLASPKQVKAFLLTQGWKPVEFTPTGDGKLTEESYPSIRGEVGKLIAERNVLIHRRNMVKNINKKGEKKGFVHNVRSDGRITADAITLGAATGRYAHKGIANLPRVTTSYGEEIRALFIVPEDKVQIGWDLSGIENRIAAHYLYRSDGGKFAKEVLDGDFHQTTADAIGITRDEAKTFRYMVLYGASPKKIAATMGWSADRAKAVYAAFWKKEYLLKRIQTQLKSAWKSTKSIKGLDGRRLYPRSDHSILNFLFQSAAAIVFKRAIVILNKKLEGVDYKRLITYHDECQEEARPEDVDYIIEQVIAACKEAGEYYNLHVPIECEAKTGKNWAECH